MEPYSDKKPTSMTLQRAVVHKNNKAAVSTTFFLEPRTEFVSGVLFVRHAVWNLQWSASEEPGLIHRPNAKASVPLGMIPTRCEMWVDAMGCNKSADELLIRDDGVWVGRVVDDLGTPMAGGRS